VDRSVVWHFRALGCSEAIVSSRSGTVRNPGTNLRSMESDMRQTVKDKDHDKRNALTETIFRDEAVGLGLDPEGFADLDEFDQQIYRGRAHKQLTSA